MGQQRLVEVEFREIDVGNLADAASDAR